MVKVYRTEYTKEKAKEVVDEYPDAKGFSLDAHFLQVERIEFGHRFAIAVYSDFTKAVIE